MYVLIVNPALNNRNWKIRKKILIRLRIFFFGGVMTSLALRQRSAEVPYSIDILGINGIAWITVRAKDVLQLRNALFASRWLNTFSPMID